jgi:small subunit ribosomal protein S1
MSTFKFFPEGWKSEDTEETKDILQGIVKNCDKDYNLHVELKNGMHGIIPRQEIEAINVDEKGYPKENLCIGKVHKYVQFKLKEKDGDKLIFSRKDVQQEVLNSVKTDLKVGDNIKGIVKNITPYGAFIDIGGGVVGLAYIEDLSVARIKTPYERLKIGQNVNIVVKSINRETGKISLSYKDTLGTWEENAKKFSVGMNTKGIIRETEKNKNGIFIELTPNLVGMAEYKEGLKYGEKVDLYIKKIDYDKKKVKVVLL